MYVPPGVAQGTQVTRVPRMKAMLSPPTSQAAQKPRSTPFDQALACLRWRG